MAQKKHKRGYNKRYRLQRICMTTTASDVKMKLFNFKSFLSKPHYVATSCYPI